MSSLPTPPRLGPRLPLPPAPRATPTDDADTPLREGDLLEGRYQIESQIGEGGVGLVYRALQLKLHRRVAVKLLQQDVVNEEPLRPRFQQEALTLAALSHPNIVALQDYGLIRGRPYLVMELLEGRTLRDILDAEGPLAPLRALGFIRQLLLALAYAHAFGIVHRDLKPANLIVQALPASEHLKVLDFGMVKLLPGSYLDRGQQLTRLGFTHGTPAYMSPEHAMGHEVDARSDLYAVGVLLFELLTGDKPFDGEVQDILRDHLTAPIPRLTSLRPELGALPGLQRLIDRAMQKERDDRYPSALEVLADVDAQLQSGYGLAGAYAAIDRADATLTEDVASGKGARLPDAIGRYAAVVVRQVRTARASATPRLARAGRELSALGARFAPALRRASDAAWARVRPRIVQAADRISRVALDAKARLEKPTLPAPRALPRALPRPSVENDVGDGDATVLDLSPIVESALPATVVRAPRPVDLTASEHQSAPTHEGIAATLPASAPAPEPRRESSTPGLALD